MICLPSPPEPHSTGVEAVSLGQRFQPKTKFEARAQASTGARTRIMQASTPDGQMFSVYNRAEVGHENERKFRIRARPDSVPLYPQNFYTH